MSLPNSVKSILACSDKKISVVVRGTQYELTPGIEADIDPIEKVSKDLEQTNVLMRSTLAGVNINMLESVHSALKSVAEAMDSLRAELVMVKEAQNRIVKELKKPVIPKYDKQSGRLVAAQRSET